MRGGVHRVADCQPPQLDAVGEELAVIPIDLDRGDSEEGRKEVHANRLLQWGEERGSVGDYSLDILPFVLQTEGERYRSATVLRVTTAAVHLFTNPTNHSPFFSALPMKPPR